MTYLGTSGLPVHNTVEYFLALGRETKTYKSKGHPEINNYMKRNRKDNSGIFILEAQ